LYSQKKTNSKLSNAEVPSFEKNKATIDVLNDFLHANQAADLRADEEMKIMKRLQDEYQCEGKIYSIHIHLMHHFYMYIAQVKDYQAY